MNRGLKKLCDIYPSVTVRPRRQTAWTIEECEATLNRLGIAFRTQLNTDRDDKDFTRYFVPEGDLLKALEAMPLLMRGFRAVSYGGGE
jgi:hypothetical protein